MIKNLLICFFTLLSIGVLNAQSFSDDFESYEVDSYVGNNADEWSTWSGNTGTTEDAKVVNDKAKSGSNSIYFYSTNQGPQDVVLLFGQKYTSGVFTLGFSIYVPEGGSAYWNFQQETTIGTTWAGNGYYRNNGALEIDAADQVLQTPFKPDEWNDVLYTIDLDNNEWIISINGECIGTLLAPASVASLDIFPLTSNSTFSEFWIDDVMFNHEPTPVSKSLDVALTNTGVDGAAFADENSTVQVIATNTGTEKVTDLKIEFAMNGGSVIEESYQDLDLEPGEEFLINLEDALSVKQGSNTIEIYLTEINGFGADDTPCNNTVVSSIPGIKPTPEKRVVVEEATGTWCQWCPRGAVYMDLMEEKYGDRFVGIAVHNSDPMANEEYDSWITSFPGFSGFPNAIVDRTSAIDPGGIETPIISRLQEPIDETFDLSAVYDSDLNELVVNVRVNAINKVVDNKKLVVALIEDEVTGTGAGYNQSNAYAGGNNGPMGGYEDLPSSVPASQMVYDIVARALFTPAAGMSLDADIEAGSFADYTFGIELDPEWELEHLNIVAIMVNPSPARTASNAMDISVEDALLLDNEEIGEVDIKVEAFPNPTTDITNITLDLGTSSNVIITLFDVSGKAVMNKDYGKLNGEQVFTINSGNLQNGVYNAAIIVNGQVINKKIIVSH